MAGKPSSPRGGRSPSGSSLSVWDTRPHGPGWGPGARAPRSLGAGWGAEPGPGSRLGGPRPHRRSHCLPALTGPCAPSPKKRSVVCRVFPPACSWSQHPPSCVNEGILTPKLTPSLAPETPSPKPTKPPASLLPWLRPPLSRTPPPPRLLLPHVRSPRSREACSQNELHDGAFLLKALSSFSFHFE